MDTEKKTFMKFNDNKRPKKKYEGLKTDFWLIFFLIFKNEYEGFYSNSFIK